MGNLDTKLYYIIITFWHIFYIDFLAVSAAEAAWYLETANEMPLQQEEEDTEIFAQREFKPPPNVAPTYWSLISHFKNLQAQNNYVFHWTSLILKPYARPPPQEQQWREEESCLNESSGQWMWTKAGNYFTLSPLSKLSKPLLRQIVKNRERINLQHHKKFQLRFLNLLNICNWSFFYVWKSSQCTKFLI